MHWNAITTFNSINMFEKSFDRQRGATLYKVYIKNSTVQCKSYRGSALMWFWAFIDSSAMATQRPQGHKARIVAFSDTSYFYSLLKITAETRENEDARAFFYILPLKKKVTTKNHNNIKTKGNGLHSDAKHFRSDANFLEMHFEV